jgi:hypothetical protein
MQSEVPFAFEQKSNEGNSFALNLVGKNNISIPILHLP